MYDANLSLLWKADIRGATVDSDLITLSEVGSVMREAGGEPMEVFIPIHEDFVGGTNITVRLFTVSSEAGANQVNHSTTILPIASLTSGNFAKVAIQTILTDADAAFMGVEIIPSGSAFTAGSLSVVIQRSNENQTTINSLK